MFRVLFGIFIILHGLVHLWFFTLSQGLIKFEPGMRVPGWTGKSWIFTGFLGDASTRSLASVLLVIATVAFVISGFSIFFRAEWWQKFLLGSAIFPPPSSFCCGMGICSCLWIKVCLDFSLA